MARNVPKASSEAARKTMQGNSGKDTSIELKVRKRLWADGYRFRKNNRQLLGTPDISFPKQKIVVFLDSCYWHGCPIHFKEPKTNSKFWSQKIKRNRERDEEYSRHYIEEGWTLLRFWEHEVRDEFERIIQTIEYYVKSSEQSRFEKFN